MMDMRWILRFALPRAESGTINRIAAPSLQSVVRPGMRAVCWKHVRQLGQLGVGGVLWLLYILAIAPLLFRVLDPLHEVRRRILRKQHSLNVEHRFRLLQHRWSAAPMDVTERTRRLRGLNMQLSPGMPHAFASQDQPIGVESQAITQLVTRLPHVPNGSIGSLDCRRIIAFGENGYIGVIKDFHGDRSQFVNELEAALGLHDAGCNVPDVLHVDFESLQIVYSYIHGTHAPNLGPDDGIRPDRLDMPMGVSGSESLFSPKEAGSPQRSAPRAERDAIAEGLRAIHRAGYTLEDISSKSVVIERDTGTPVFVDLARALPLRRTSGSLSIYMRDRDAAKLNREFGTGLMTAAALRKLRQLPGGAIYAPVYVGQGIRWGAVWNPDVGIGRWRFVMAQHLPVPYKGRVLDLGANNGFNALQMLRSGASEIVAVELDPKAIQQGKFLKMVWEWRDNRRYNLTFVQGSHGSLSSLRLGTFDQVTAFCTLYYLSKEEMVETVRYLKGVTDTLVQQANTDQLISRKYSDTFEKASLEFAVKLAEENGFPETRIVAPTGYSRPLIVSRSSKTSDSSGMPDVSSLSQVAP